MPTPDLALAYDLPAAEYSVGGLRLRPYSLAAHRRAGLMGLATASAGLAAARRLLSPMALRRELDALHWLLAAPLEAVRGAFCSGGADAAWSCVEVHTLPPGSVAEFAAHLDWILCLCRAALFDAVEREMPGAASAPEDDPPDLFAPTLHASLAVSLCEKLNVDDERLMEWIPFPRVLQYAHAVQHANPYVWTVRPRSLAPDPYGERIEADPGFGEAVAF